MNHHHRLEQFRTVVVLIIFIRFVFSARTKEFVVDRFSPCLNSSNDKYTVRFPDQVKYTISKNVVQLHGNFNVTETIQEPLEMALITNRCSMDMKSCEQFNKMTVSRLCSVLSNEKNMWTSFYKSVDPDLRCPFQPGIYKFINSSSDLSFFRNFPLEGFRWQVYMKFYTTKNKAKREIFCLTIQGSKK
ncbi:uncharacterized protein LOC129749374 [Uranotaenia lowii]|uniref:uncharacterized protein LOC129749374 n=1 Tax=Uranotaenia lowii TaxID=190385 RepID=UPI00247AE70F|nr:uncharacterized protein LOC129749374 [Uranotaenia lowii]